MAGFLGVCKTKDKIKVPFDLKITKLQHNHWHRKDVKQLAKELLKDQGKYRYSIENRLVIVFDGSVTSDVLFFKKYRSLLIYVLLQACYNPRKHWFFLPEYKTWQCIILIPPLRNNVSQEHHEHSIGPGVREHEKAEFENRLLQEVAKCSNGLLEVNPNSKQHGVDGWIWLPSAMLAEEKQKV